MKNKLTVLLVVAVVIVVGILSFVFNKNSLSEVTHIKIAYLPIVQGLPLYLAIDKGYFKDAGIDIEAVKFDAPNQIIDAVMSGQVDFAAPGAATGIAGIAETKNPGHIRIFALTGGDDKVSNDSILVKNDSKITTVSELKGKKLGILPGIQWRTIAADILAQNNLTADKDVTLVELAAGLQAQALASGQIDVLLGVEPTPTIVKANNLGKEIVAVPTVKYISNPFYGGVGAVNLQFVKQNPNVTTKVLGIFSHAIAEINQNPDAARQYLKNYTPLTDNLIAQVPISLFKMYDSFSQDDLAALQKFYDIFTASKVVDGKIDVQKFLYSPSGN